MKKVVKKNEDVRPILILHGADKANVSVSKSVKVLDSVAKVFQILNFILNLTKTLLD